MPNTALDTCSDNVFCEAKTVPRYLNLLSNSISWPLRYNLSSFASLPPILKTIAFVFIHLRVTLSSRSSHPRHEGVDT